MEGLELVCFEMISNAGAAKSNFIEALQVAKEGQLEEAKALMQEGHQMLIDAHKAHSSLISKEAAQENIQLTLLLVHAEDQLMSCETIKLLITELIEVHQVLNQGEILNQMTA